MTLEEQMDAARRVRDLEKRGWNIFRVTGKFDDGDCYLERAGVLSPFGRTLEELEMFADGFETGLAAGRAEGSEK